MIGVAPSPTLLGNDRYGLWLDSNFTNTVGGSGAGNIIGGNGSDGVYVSGANQVIETNQIGVAANSSLTLLVGNTANGIRVSADNAQIGGDTAGLGNVIGANRLNGIQLDAAATDAIIRGNDIGTDAIGNIVGNAGSGVQVNDVAVTAISTPPVRSSSPPRPWSRQPAGSATRRSSRSASP